MQIYISEAIVFIKVFIHSNKSLKPMWVCESHEKQDENQLWVVNIHHHF